MAVGHWRDPRCGDRGRSGMGGASATVSRTCPDRFSPFATQTIPATVHEAPYIFDGLLMNETGRRVREQYADTGGFTDHVIRRVLDPRLLVRPAHPGPALEAPLRVRTRGRPEAPGPAGRRQGERGPDRPELGGHPPGGVHPGGRNDAAEPAPASDGSGSAASPLSGSTGVTSSWMRRSSRRAWSCTRACSRMRARPCGGRSNSSARR